MKKLLLIPLLILTHATLFAQTWSFSAAGGFVFAGEHRSSTPFFKYSGANFIMTYSANGLADFNFRHFSLQTGLCMAGEGGKANVIFTTPQSASASNGSIKSKLTYLRIPADFIYHIRASGGTLNFGAGLYTAIGLFGSESVTANDETTNSPGTVYHYSLDGGVKFGSSGYALLQGGINATVGFQFKNRMLLTVNYDWGLTNLYGISSYQEAYNRALSISLGYCFK